MKKHLGFTLFFAAVLAVFLWRVITLKAGFIYGDYAAQFYPWSMIYADALKKLTLPFWTRYLQSGFPLMAEGQIAGFYPLNILFFGLLPFRSAYNYIVVFHFALAGMFTYVYSRRIGACQWGGALAALLFTFGSAYAGCMINTTTVKVLAWFPFTLWLFEAYFDRRGRWYMAGAGAVLGIQMLAGATQVAFYCAFFYAVYFLYGLRIRRSFAMADFLNLLLAAVVAGAIFAPQFMLSRVIAGLSWRSGASIDFALSDSFSPLNFIGLVFPYSVYWGARFYIGVLSLLFLIMSVYSLKSQPKQRPVFLLLLLSVFFTLGRYNPLYVFLVKISHIYSFRGPSKAILLGIFAASVMSGVGFTGFFAPSWCNLRQKALRCFSIFIAVMMGLFFLAKGALIIFKQQIIAFGEWYVTEHIYGKSFHRFDLATYLEKVQRFYDNMVQNLSVINPFILVSLVLCVAGLLISWIFLTNARQNTVYHKTMFFVLIFLDLLAFSVYGTGFRGNILEFRALAPEKPAVFGALKEDTGLFRILPYDMASAKLPNWAMPSMNAVHGIDSVALYTPLVNEYYRKALEELEVVDNALGLKGPMPDSLDKNLELVRMLNVKYVVSPGELDKPFLEPVAEEDGTYLYRVSGYLPRAFAAKELIPDMIDRSVKVDIVSYGSGEAFIKADMPYDGFLVFSENRYPGWQAYVDGEEAEILPFSVIQAVKLPAGRHEVWFGYRAFGGGSKK